MARTFNGSTDQIDGGNGVVEGATESNSCWIKASALSNAYMGIYCRTNGIASFHSILLKSTGKFATYVDTNAGSAQLDPGTNAISTGAWHHFAWTYGSSGGLKTFLDGASDGTSNIGTALLTNYGTTNTGIGYDPANVGRGFPGSIADVALWNVALSASEITALARGVRPLMIRPANIIHYMPLDGLSSPEPDFSGKKNNGTLTGTTFGSGPPITLVTPRRLGILAASSFVPAWAKGANLPVLGTGNF